MNDKIEENIIMITQFYDKEDIIQKNWANLIVEFMEQLTDLVQRRVIPIYLFVSVELLRWTHQRIQNTACCYGDWIRRSIHPIKNFQPSTNIPNYSMVWIVKK